MNEIKIGNTTFYYDADKDIVGEVGTTCKWSPDRGGYMSTCRGNVALTSFGNFGSYPTNITLANAWCDRAREAYEALTA